MEKKNATKPRNQREKERKEEEEENRERWSRSSMKDKKKKKKKKKTIVLERAKSLTMGSMYVCLFTKMQWKLSFDNLKTPKMCFQFP